MKIDKPTCFQLVGVPGSGKSTWARQAMIIRDDCTLISTDAYVEEYARCQNKTYSDVFQDYMPTAVELMIRDVHLARRAQRNIIWDQTSTTIASRRKKFIMLPEYDHIALVFKTPSQEELNRRLKEREKDGKIIPAHVLQQMIDRFELPSLREGFVSITTYEQPNQRTN